MRDRKRLLFENIVRLRRAQRESPGSGDISAVRAALEKELGETVSRRFAAAVLGVSHTALARWIDAGDLPLVYSASDRFEVPVSALLDLYEAVEQERDRGNRRRHLLEPAMTEGRNRANRMRTNTLVPGESEEPHGHSRAERRSLAYHRALAPKLRRPMLDEARHLVQKWRGEGKLDATYAERWEDVLRKPVVDVRELITADTPLARDLRQNSPFAGMLSEPERRKILDDIR